VKTKLSVSITLAITCFLISLAWGDSLELKNGSLIKGRYMGGTESTIDFRVGSSVQHYARADVASITFESGPPATNSRSTPEELMPRPEMAPVPAPSAAGSINVPAGTHILVRTIDAVDSDKNQVGDKFSASLEQPLVVNDVIVAPKGADVYGKLSQASSAGHIQGRSQLKLELTGIVVNGQTIPLVTGEYSLSGSSRGATTAKRVGAGAGVGALIGALAGGGKGAAIGAGVGGGAGTAVQVITKGEQVHVPSETLLDFTLQQEVRMPMAD